MVKLVLVELQMFVWIRSSGLWYSFGLITFHRSSTWVQKGLLILGLRVSRFCVRKAIGVGVLFVSKIFAQSSAEV